MDTTQTTETPTLFGTEPGTGRWIHNDPLPPQWLVNGLIHRNVIALLDGLGDSGKSILALQLAIDIATGSKFLNTFQCERGKVLYLNAEDPDNQSHHRFNSMVKCRQQKLSDIEQNITYISFNELQASPRLMKAFKGGNVETDTFLQLQKFCEAWKPDLIVLDPLVYFGNVEADAETVIDFYTQLKKLKTTILILHHMSKAGMNGEAAQRAKARGSSAITENSKTRMSLEGGKLIIDKNNYGKKMTLELELRSERKGHLCLEWSCNYIQEEVKPGRITGNGRAEKVGGPF